MKNKIIFVLLCSTFIFSGCLRAGKLVNETKKTDNSSTLKKEINYKGSKKYNFDQDDNSLYVIYRKEQKNNPGQIVIDIEDEDTQGKHKSSIRLKEEMRRGCWIGICGYWVKFSLFPALYRQIPE